MKYLMLILLCLSIGAQAQTPLTPQQQGGKLISNGATMFIAGSVIGATLLGTSLLATGKVRQGLMVGGIAVSVAFPFIGFIQIKKGGDKLQTL